MSDASNNFYNQAIDAVQVGQLDRAIKLTEESLVEDPADTLTWQLYVKLLAAAGRTKDAAKATEKLKTLGLGEVDSLMIDAAKQIAEGDLDAAIATFESASELEPRNPELHSSRAMALLQKGDKSAALAAARQAVELAPTDSRANYALGHLLRISGEKDEALQVFGTALADEPDFMPALYEEGMLLAEKGRLEKALANFEKFSAAQPEDENARLAIENIRKELRRTDTF